MATNVNMDSNFLKNSRTTSYSSDKRSQYITWDCYPGDVYYNYVVPGGYTQRKGLHAADGVHRWNGSKYVKASTRCCYEKDASSTPSLGEGVKCIKIQYRINNGSWKTYKENANGIPWADRKLEFTSTKNGEIYEVKCTYQVWTMGSPFRDVPFMWFGDKSGYYNSGKNQFKSGGPADPQRPWSGMCDYTANKNGGTDKNASWKIVSKSWTRPNSTSYSTNWTYLHSKYCKNHEGTGGWSSTYLAEFYKKNMDNGTNMGWTGNVTGRNPQTCRKCLWWNFQRTFSNTYTSTGIVEKPAKLTNPTVSIKTIDNLTNVDADNQYNGIKGQVKVTYKQAEKKAGYVNVYAVTTDASGKAKTVKVISDNAISNGSTETYTISFTKEDFGFVRSKSIAYYAEAYVIDTEYSNTKRYGYSSGKTFTDCTANGKHYYNDEPPAPTTFKVVTTGDRTEKMKVEWSAVTDPDKHAFNYYLYVQRNTTTYPTDKSVKIRINGTNKTIKYHDEFEIASTTTDKTLDTTVYKEGEKLNMYIVAKDKYYNNYYNGTSLNGSVDEDLTVSLNVTDNMTVKDADGKLSGEHGYLSFTYENKHNRKGRIRIYAYMSDKNYNKNSGAYLKRVYDSGEDVSTYISPGTYSVKIDFDNKGMTRGRYIKYYAVANDSADIATKKPYAIDDARMWEEAKGYHYYNSVPSAVKPFVSEKYATTEDIFLDEVLEIGWPESKDLEDHDIHYKLYMQVVGESGNKTEVCYTKLTDAGVTREYTKTFDLGTNVSADADFPYEIKMETKKYIGKTINLWIKTYDKYNAKKYLSSTMLSLNNPGVKPEVPEIEIDYVYGDDFYGRDKQSGEEGYVSVSHSHETGRAATVRLYAIAKRIDGKMKVFAGTDNKGITSWKLSSGSWSAKTKLNFPKIFGEDWRSSEIRYYAVATTDLGESSEKDGWTPKTSMWEDWVPGHKFNEEPGTPKIKFVDKDSNLHYNAVIEWDPVTDPDDTLYPVIYTVVFSVKSDPRREMTFFHGSNKVNDEIKTFTEMWDTTNTRIDIDLDGYDEGEEFEVWVVPHDDWVNSYYYTSNTIKFEKATFGKPKVEVTLSQTESERGKVKIKYLHEDVEYKDGKYVSKDPDKEVEDFVGLIYIYCYINDRFTANLMIEGEKFKIGQEKTYTIEFEDVSPLSRSVEIRYVVIAEDQESEVRNTDISPSKAEVSDFVNGSHYYNDEPTNPEVFVGSLQDYVSDEVYQKDKYVYGFNYAFLCWDRPYEYDDDRCVYYVYLKTPKSFKETVRNTTITRLDDSMKPEPVFIEYTRKYKIVEKYDKNNKLYGCDVYYRKTTSENSYEKIQGDNPFLGFQIDYLKDHLGKEWPLIRKADAEKAEFVDEHCKIYVEARDTRSLTNSYYGLSNEFDTYRIEHEPPDDVKLEVIPNLSDGIGNGEEGKIKVTYTHPEGDINGKVDIYAFQNDKNNNYILKGKVYTIDTICNGVEQTITIDFLNSENSPLNSEEDRILDRSKNITYYAIATDGLVGKTSFDKYEEIGLEMKYIPYLIPDENGKYNFYELNINGVLHDFNKDGHYEGPVQSGAHYFNEEPPFTTPVEVNEEFVTFDSAEIKWEHVKDPDNDAVKYEIYVASSDEHMNIYTEEFFNDALENKAAAVDTDEHDESMDIEPAFYSDILTASGTLAYHKKIEIPFSVAASAANGLSVATSEYAEDAAISMWIVSKDSYTNSYYRAGDILTLLKGHKARDPRSIYPRNGSTVFATKPRILINLAEDNQRQTVYVNWKDQTYNNKDNPEYFSSLPGTKEAIVFKPPVAYTTLHGMKVTYSVWVHNQCSYSNKIYSTYTYNNFFEQLTEDRLIALKSAHINLFRRAVNITRDAYGLETYKFTRDIQKNMIFENFDFNETKNAICGVNDLLNNADDSKGLDYNNKLIVNIKDLDLVEYEHDIETGSYNEFLEWARLVYILENL